MLREFDDNYIIESIKENYDLQNGVATFNGEITNQDIATSLQQEYTQIELLVGFKLK